MASLGNKGDACYFPRDLSRGSYGGDVHCFQQFLSHKGYLMDDPTGYYGEKTATAAKRWQKDTGLGAESGEVDLKARVKYANQHGLPAPGSGRVSDDAKANEKNTCIDVCAEFTGTQDCQTRCVKNVADKKHACREACQMAFGAACDRAFPTNVEGGASNFKICLNYLAASCEDTCKQFRN
mmetsp:Transcript_33915/g.83173  ORF Transcript_33915/g.83173 Transcript_33915/m.83173 type:complete len:181 (-) Transcript_33915:117-659(-)